jgi:demethylmenaquinone methyltransferase/2-methoxy-6-polyprenyl-1,4-benzoquinol methylase
MTRKSVQHQTIVASMFGRIAPGYDAANRVLSLGVDTLWRRRLIRGVESAFLPGTERVVLDLATGTLDVSLALVRSIPGTRVIAMDFCLPMLLAGKKKLERAGYYERGNIDIAAGNGLCLPLPDACVDAVTVSFGLRNMVPHDAAMSEAHRVLKKGGVFHLLEFGSGKGRIFGGLYNFYLTKVLPLIGGFIAKDRQAYNYLANTITNFPEAPILGKELAEAGFTDVAWQKLWGGIVYLYTARK